MPTVLKSGGGYKLVLLSIRPTLNNIFFTVYTRRGNVLFYLSAGQAGFKGPRRATPLAAEQTARAVRRWLAAANFRSVELKLFSLYRGRMKAAVKGLVGLKIQSITLAVRSPHGLGCRPKKLRRV